MFKDSTTCISLFTVAVSRLIVIALLCLAPFLSALAIGPGYSGTWYNPAQDGHGFSIEISEFPDGTPVGIVIWYIYDDQGNPMFMVGEGAPYGNQLLVIFERPWGMEFGVFDPSSVYREDGGTGLLEFTGENSATFKYTPSEDMEKLGHSPINIPLVKFFDSPPFYTLPLGKGYDIYGSYADRTQVKEAILDGTALTEARRVMSFDLDQSEYTSIQGTDIREYASSLTQSAGVSGHYLGFSGSIKQSFDESRYTSNEYSFATVAVNVYKQAHIVTDRRDVESLKPFLHHSFSKRLNDPDYLATDLFRTYGTHCMTGILMGARLDYNVSAESSTIAGDKSIGVYAEASYKSALVGVEIDFSIINEQEWSDYKSSEWKSLRAVGGSSEFAIEVATKSDYDNWLKTIDDRHVFSDYFPDSLTPIWEFCDDDERKADILEAFEDWKDKRSDFLPDVPPRQAVLGLFVANTNLGDFIDIDGIRYFAIPQDLNEGAGGKTILIYVSVGPDNDPAHPPITDLIMWNMTNDPTTKPDAAYVEAGGDLNEGVGGDTILLYYSTSSTKDEPVRAVATYNGTDRDYHFSPDASLDQFYEDVRNTVGKTQDTSEGAGGDTILVKFSRDYID